MLVSLKEEPTVTTMILDWLPMIIITWYILYTCRHFSTNILSNKSCLEILCLQSAAFHFSYVVHINFVKYLVNLVIRHKSSWGGIGIEMYC